MDGLLPPIVAGRGAFRSFGAELPKILTRCPVTTDVVATRLSMDASTFALLNISGHELDCSSCGQSHKWEQAKAWVEGEPEPAGDGAERMAFPDFSRRRSIEREVTAELERIERMFGRGGTTDPT